MLCNRDTKIINQSKGFSILFKWMTFKLRQRKLRPPVQLLLLFVFHFPELFFLQCILFKMFSGNGYAEGQPPCEPDFIFTLSVSDMQNMIMGCTRPLQAYMSGILKASGDLSVALSLEDFGKKVMERIRSDANE